MDGVALKPLTVDFHAPGFATTLAGENAQPFWFQMHDDQRQQAGYQWGPANPQALNRYSYVLNNPVKYTDPSGHFGVTIYTALPGYSLHFTHDEAVAMWNFATAQAPTLFTTAAGIAALTGFDSAKWLAGLGAPAIVVAVAALLGQIGITAANILLVVAAFGAVTKGADWLYGGQGLDFHCVAVAPVCSGFLPPTVERQSGLWVAPHFFAKAQRAEDIYDDVQHAITDFRQRLDRVRRVK